MVAELQPIGNSEHATLLCYSTAKGGWVEKELAHSPRHPEHWGSNGVISLDGKLWWVDLSYGLLPATPSLAGRCCSTSRSLMAALCQPPRGTSGRSAA